MAEWWEEVNIGFRDTDGVSTTEDTGNWWETVSTVEASDSSNWWETPSEPSEKDEGNWWEVTATETKEEEEEDTGNWWEATENVSEIQTPEDFSGIEMPEEEGLFGKTLEGLKGLAEDTGEGALDVGKSIGKGLGTFYTRMASGLGSLAKAYSFMMPEGHLGKDFVDAQGDLIQSTWSEKGKDFVDPRYAVNPWDNPKIMLDPGFAAYHIASQAPLFLIGAASIPAATATGFTQIFGSTYDELKKEGLDDERALRGAAIDGAVGSVLEALGLKGVLKEGGKWAIRGVKGMASEGFTEGMQSIESTIVQEVEKGYAQGLSTNQIAKKLWGEKGDIFYDAFGEATIGALIGGPASILSGDTKTQEDIDKDFEEDEFQEDIPNLRHLNDKVNENIEKEAMLSTVRTSMAEGIDSDVGAAINPKRPPITMTETGPVRNHYDASGKLIHQTQLPRNAEYRHIGSKGTVTREQDTRHITSKSAGHQAVVRRIPISMEEIQQRSAEAIERGAKTQEIIDLMTELSKRPLKPKSAEESAQILAPEGPLVPTKSAQESAQVLAGAEEYVPPYTGTTTGRPSTAQEAAGVLAPEGPVVPFKSAEESAQVLSNAEEFVPTYTGQTTGRPSSAQEAAGVLAPEGPLVPTKSAEESAAIFEQESDVLDAIVASIEAGEINARSGAEAIVEDQLSRQSAEESAQVFEAERAAMLTAMDDAVQLYQKGKTDEAIAEIKRAVKRKGKSAEKSAQYFETAETRRVDVAREEYAKALAMPEGDAKVKAEEKAGNELYAALKAAEQAEIVPVTEQTTTVDTAPETTPLPRQNIQVDENAETFFDEASGTPTVAVASPEEVLMREQEAGEAQGDMQQAPETKPAKARRVDVQVEEKVATREGQDLVQAIINGDQKAVKKALNKFPVNMRPKAYQQASKDAMELARTAGVYDIKAVEDSIEANKSATKTYDYDKFGKVKVTPDQEVSGVWTATDETTGDTYSIFKYNDSYIVQDKDGNTTEHPSLEAAGKSLQSKSKPDYFVVNTKKKGQNQWEVHGPDGIVSAGKVGGGKGYRTEKLALAKAAELNNVEPAASTQTSKKKEYTSKAEDYATGKAKVPKKKTPKKAPKRLVIKRKEETSTEGQVDTKTPTEGTVRRIVRTLESIVEKVVGGGKFENVNVSQLHSRLGTKEYIKQQGGPDLSSTWDVLEGILPEGLMEGIQVDFVDAPSGRGIVGEWLPREKRVVMYTKNRKGNNINPKLIAATMMHEVVHGVTHENLQYDPDIRAELDKLRDDVARQILSQPAFELYREYRESDDRPNSGYDFNSFLRKELESGKTWKDLGFKDREDARAVYMLLNNDEFVANATHPLMKRKLQGVPVDVRMKFMDKVKAILARIFGMTDSQFNAFDQVMSAIGRLNEEIEFEIVDDNEISVEETYEGLAELDPDEELTGIELLNKQTERRIEILKRQEERGDITKKDKGFIARTRENMKDAAELMRDIAVGINERLEAIHPQLAFRMRHAEAGILQSNKTGSLLLGSFQKLLHKEFRRLKFSDAQKDTFYLALFNGDRKVIDGVMEGNKRLAKSFYKLEEYRKVIEQELIEVGALRPKDLIKDYTWHREVADLPGLTAAMKKDAARRKAEKAGEEIDPNADYDMDDMEFEIEAALPQLKALGMTEEDARAFIIEKVMRTGNYPAVMRTAKGTKQRKFPKIPEKYQQFYKDPFESMANHIEEANEVIYMRKLLGTTQFKQNLKDLNRVQKEIDNTKPGDKRDKLVMLATRIEESILKSQESLRDGVAAYVDGLVKDGTITEDQRITVAKLINARVTQIGITSKTLQNLRNLGLIGTLGHISNTLTQLKDGSLIIYRHGILRSTSSLVKSIFRQNSISAKEFDLQRIMNEFRSGNDLINIQTIFKYTGFTALDNALKTVNLQSHVDTLRRMAKKNPDKLRHKYGPRWGTEMTETIIEQLNSGKITPEVKQIALTELSRDVPVFLSEMPVAYNVGKNARIFYTLKSYAVKIMNIAMRDGINLMIKGKGMQRLKGAKNLVALGLIVGLMGGGVEELKDLLIGRETPFWDNVGDEMLQLFFLSRYTLDQVERQGLGAFAEGMFALPALDMFTAMAKTLGGSPEGLRYLPIPGAKEIYYRGTQTGKDKILKQNRESIFGNLRNEIQTKGRISNKTRKKVREYNKDIKGSKDLKPITFETIKRNRKRYLEEKKDMGILQKVFSKLSPKSAFAAEPGNVSEKHIHKLITKHAQRMNLNPVDAQKNLGKFMALVAYAESRGDLKAKNPKSTAEGMYQFIDGSIEPAMNRLARTIGWQSWMREVVRTKNVSALDWYQQTLMFLAQMLEMEGSDEYMREILRNGDYASMESAYYNLHHTKPDVATVRNWNRAVKEVLGDKTS